jgi:hypothetical protein
MSFYTYMLINNITLINIIVHMLIIVIIYTYV